MSAISNLIGGPVTAETIESWHEFYLMAGTAAVTLVGLLFVALSFHLEAMLHEKRSHLLAAARLAFMNFIFVLMLSLFFLVPGTETLLVGVATIVLSVVSLGGVVWDGLRNRVKGKATGHEAFLSRRYMVSGFFMGLAIMTAYGLITSPTRSHLYRLVPVVCAMLANGAGMSWDLLVQVGRMRRVEQAAGEGGPK